MDGYWATAELSQNHRSDGLTERLAVLPALLDLVVDSKGQMQTHLNAERLGVFRGVDDLTNYGYHRVEPVRGLKIFHQFLSAGDPNVVRAVVPSQALRSETLSRFRPQYRPLAKRMPLGQAEAIFATAFPGINFAYLRLLIAARRLAEGGVGQPAMIAVDGPSGAGKSHTIRIAAALIGDQHQDVTWTPQSDRFRTGLNEAAQSAGLVSCDEIIKLAVAGGDIRTHLSPLLTFVANSTVHKYYIGPVTVHHVPAIIITDTSYPAEVRATSRSAGALFTSIWSGRSTGRVVAGTGRTLADARHRAGGSGGRFGLCGDR